jgi:ABC-type transport system involved in cytochrome c biogenesis permease subunit
MGIATFVEKTSGSEHIYTRFYGSAWFIALWATLAIYALIYLIAQRMYKRIPVFSIHIALLLILLGALLTHLSAENGQIHLRDDEHTHFFQNKNRGLSVIPFTLKLVSFHIEHYPGTESPSDYVSKVEVNDPLNNRHFEAQISMNKILSYKGYRFYQSSFDDDMNGSILSINRDVYGIPVTYAGYYLLFLSMLLMSLDKNGGFRNLLRNPVLKKSILTICTVLLLRIAANASPVVTDAGNTINRYEASRLGKIWMLYEGRVVPLQTFARDFTTKLTGKPAYKPYNAEQVLFGFLFFAEKWLELPIFDVNNHKLRHIIGKEKASVNDFFILHNSEKQYKLAAYYKEIYQGGKQSSFAKEAAKLDECIQIINILMSGDLPAVFPYQINGGIQWYSANSTLPDDIFKSDKNFIHNFFNNYQIAIKNSNSEQIGELLAAIENYQQQKALSFLPSDRHRRIEIFYNNLNIFMVLFKFNLAVGLLALVIFILQIVKNMNFKQLSNIIYILLIISFITLTIGLSMRTYIGGRLPLGNGFETMLFTAWCTLLIALCLRRYPLIIPSFGFLVSGFALLVVHQSAMNPKITNLLPVLSSPLLSIHVSVIMFAYALAAFMAMNSLATFILLIFGRQDNQESLQFIIKLNILSRIFLYPCVCCLATGIFIGAIWANVSWGRYWGWDPKEVWALITLLLAALPFHSKTLAWFRNTFFYNVYVLIIAASISMTYFGVNYFLGGMHSYAGDAELNLTSVWPVFIVLLLILLAYRKYKLLKIE